MQKPPTAQSPCSNWRELYQAALLETDRGRMSQRIAVAEQALVTRGRELFFAGAVDPTERRAVEHALNALHALENCLGLKHTA
jgi:hypothetical protein